MNMSEKKKPNGVQLLIRTVVTDPKGKVIQDSGQKKARSFVIQFLEGIYSKFQNVASKSFTAVDGTEDPFFRASWGISNYINAMGVTNDDLHGIVVGTGDTPATNTDYKLETQLTEGAGAGNITHGAQVIDPAAVVGANVEFEAKRSFPNNTGSTITIKEAGMYVMCQTDAVIYGYFCIIRDVLSPAVDVPDKCALTVYYTFRTTV